MKNCGIYTIYCAGNDKWYVGQSSDVDNRFSTHKATLNRNAHGNKHLQASWNRYGHESFCFKKFLTCSYQNLTFFEQKVFNEFVESGRILFNQGRIVDCPNRGRLFEQSHRDNISKSLKGRVFTENHCARIGLAMRGKVAHNKGSTHTLEARRKISASCRGRLANNRKQIICLETQQVFSSITEAAKEIGCDNSFLAKAVKKNRKVKGMTFLEVATADALQDNA